MATLYYISASRVKGADQYKLYEDVEGTKTTIRISKNLQPFNLNGIMWNGKEVERYDSVAVGFSSISYADVHPIWMLTEKGILYGIRIEFEATVKDINDYTYARNFETVYYLSPNEYPFSGFEKVDYTRTTVKFSTLVGTNIEKEEDGYYLYFTLDDNTKKVRFSDLDGNISDIMFGKGQTTVKVYSNFAGNSISKVYKHTGFIPIYSLSNDWSPNVDNEEVCVGPFSISRDFEYHKMSFYNKNLKFVGGATTSYLAQKYGDTKEYFNGSEVGTIAGEVTGHNVGSGDEDAPVFVIFCSYKDIIDDYVCVGNNGYFPLFEMDLPEGDHVLSVTADSDSDHYEESVHSDPVTYTAPNKNQS